MRARARVHTHTLPLQRLAGAHTSSLGSAKSVNIQHRGRRHFQAPLIYGTSFSPCKKAKLTVGSLRVCARVLFIKHMPLPRRNAQRPPYALFLEVADPFPVSAHSTGPAREHLRLEKIAFTPEREQKEYMSKITPRNLWKNTSAVGFRPV